MHRRRTLAIAGLALALAASLAAIPRVRGELAAMIGRVQRRSVADRLAGFGPAVAARLAPDLAAAGVAAPRRLLLVGFKDTARLELYAAADETGAPARVRAWPI